MEPTNHPFGKENGLPNLHDYVPCKSSGVYIYNIYILLYVLRRLLHLLYHIYNIFFEKTTFLPVLDSKETTPH